MATGKPKSKRRKRKRPFAKQINQGYHVLSVANTVSHILHGDIGALVKHLMRKRAHKKLGGFLK